MTLPMPLEQQMACILQVKHQEILKMPKHNNDVSEIYWTAR